MGEFEQSLVFFHRGYRLRPEQEAFRLGIQKAQEAIDNAVGSASQVALTKEGDLTYFEEQQTQVVGTEGLFGKLLANSITRTYSSPPLFITPLNFTATVCHDLKSSKKSIV